jgi:molybdopterin molybdotransferase
MPEFLSLVQPDEARQILINQLSPKIETEVLSISLVLGRVTAEAVRATMPLPSFHRSTVDGYAVRAVDTYGASESLPAYLRLVGEVLMGSTPEYHLDPTECVLIHTGGMLPDAADAVVMIEHTQEIREDEIEVLRSVAIGENVLLIGEDVQQDDIVLPAGRLLRPAEIGGLAALGIARVSVASRPKVGIISTGDEIISPTERIRPGQVYDVNSYSLSALVEQAGAIPILYGICPDRMDALQSVAARALNECQIVVITAGSSASARDLTAQVIDSLGEPGVLVHGVNVRPGKPTILAVCQGKTVIGLPGNPVSALVIASLFLQPVIRLHLGLPDYGLVPGFSAILSINLPSRAGREDWIPVRVSRNGNKYYAEPLFGKSNLIFHLASADGLIRIPPDATGLAAGESVDVYPL